MIILIISSFCLFAAYIAITHEEKIVYPVTFITRSHFHISKRTNPVKSIIIQDNNGEIFNISIRDQRADSIYYHCKIGEIIK
jgi:hypothetical protein